MKKKILMILTEFPPAIGGMQTHAILLSKHLADLGMDVIVYTYKPSEDVEESRLVDASFPFPVKRKLSRISYFYTIDVLVNAVRQFQPDIIYCSTVFYGILEKLTGVPTICRSVGNDVLRPWIIYPFRRGAKLVSSYFIEKKLYQFFKKLRRPEIVEILFRKKRLELTINAAKASGKILANSEYTKDALLNHGVSGKKIEILVGGVDTNYFEKPINLDKLLLRKELNLPENKTILLTACRLVDKKGVDFLIETMGILSNNEFRNKHNLANDYHLVIVGQGRRFNKYKQMAIDMGLEQHITFTGAVSYYDMPPYYWASDIFVLASTVYKDPLTGLFDAETMGRVLCEANAAGIPIIATRSGGIPSVITDGENGLLFSENDNEAFIAKLRELVDPVFAELIVNNGIYYAKNKFDWQHILGSHSKVFRSVNEEIVAEKITFG